MDIRLPPDLELFVRSEVSNGHFTSENDAVTEIVRDYYQRKQTIPDQPNPEIESSPERKPVWEWILERTANIPDAEWDKLPTDMAEQHDHYLYGTAKRPTS